MIKEKFTQEINDSFIKSQLMENENILFITKESNVLYFLPILYFFISIIICFIYFPIGLIGMCFSILYFFNTYLLINTSLYVITNQKLIIKTGFIQRQITSLPLSKIESIDLGQSIMGRLLNYGIVNINGIGGSRARAYIISNPLSFQSIIYENKKL